MIKTAILTISDKGSRGEREDCTGPSLEGLIKKEGYELKYYKVIPDDIHAIESELIYICDELRVELVLTNGGTGFSKRDVTPEATLKVIEKYVPGFGEVMRFKALAVTPKAVLTRGIAGIRGNSLIINLPGSPKGAVENLGFIIEVIPHGIDILTGKATECGRK